MALNPDQNKKSAPAAYLSPGICMELGLTLYFSGEACMSEISQKRVTHFDLKPISFLFAELEQKLSQMYSKLNVDSF